MGSYPPSVDRPAGRALREQIAVVAAYEIDLWDLERRGRRVLVLEEDQRLHYLLVLTAGRGHVARHFQVAVEEAAPVGHRAFERAVPVRRDGEVDRVRRRLQRLRATQIAEPADDD